MKISEILDPSEDLFDVLSNPALAAFDRYYENLARITNGFDVGRGFLNAEIVEELAEDFEEIRSLIDSQLLRHPKWVVRVQVIQKWLDK